MSTEPAAAHSDICGRLEIEWTGRSDSPSFHRAITLNTAQMVQAMYGSFRSFVESERYDPVAYEQLNFGEICDLVVVGGYRAVATCLVTMDSLRATCLVDAITDFAAERSRGAAMTAPLDHFTRMADVMTASWSKAAESLDSYAEQLLGATWTAWSPDRRRRHVDETLRTMWGNDSFGENLTRLGSVDVEAWLFRWATGPRILPAP